MAKKARTSKKKNKPYVDKGRPDGHPETNIYNHSARIIDQPVNPK